MQSRLWLLLSALLLCLSGAASRARAADAEGEPYNGRVTALQREERAAQRMTLEGEALRTLPGAMGDPFRALGLLPGVASPLGGLPLYAIRGASPGMSGYYLDGMRLPQLFHMLIGGAVIHPGTIERVDLYPSAYDVTIGRQTGGVATAQTRPARGDRHHLELELRLLDVGGHLELALPRDVRVSVSGHYGYPGPLLRAVDNQIHLAYWDYQLRVDVGPLTVQALGSYDELSYGDTDLTGQVAGVPGGKLTFHRLQARSQTRHGPLKIDAALVGGYDQMADPRGNGVSKLALSARLDLLWRLPRVSLLVHADGELSRFLIDDDFDSGSFIGGGSTLREPEPGTTKGAQSFDKLGELAENRLGGIAGAAAQGVVDLIPGRLTLTAGIRADVYHAGGVTLLGFDPRAQLHARLTEWLQLRVSAGYYQQPPSFPLQLPGIDTFALRLGLQRAAHGALSQEAQLPQHLRLSVTGYYQQYRNVTDVPPLGALVCGLPTSEKLTSATALIVRVTDGSAMGMELLLRRHSGRVTGWIAYSLSRAERRYPCGIRPADYDQMHVLNIAVQAQLPRGVVAGARLQVATGRPVTEVELPDWEATRRNNRRLPTFVQLDVRVDKKWQLKRVLLTLFVEVINCTYSQTALLLHYPSADSPVGYDFTQPQVVGFRWVLPSIGLRGSF